MSAGLVKKVLEQLVGVVATQMLKLVKSVKKFSLNGVFHVSHYSCSVQLSHICPIIKFYVEVMVLQTKLNSFLADQSKYVLVCVVVIFEVWHCFGPTPRKDFQQALKTLGSIPYDEK